MQKLKFILILGLLAIIFSACARVGSFFGDIPQVGTPTRTIIVTPRPSATSEILATATSTKEAVVDYCVSCHTDKQKLIKSAGPEQPQPTLGNGVDLLGEVPKMESWQKVLVDGEFPSSIHGLNGCVDCHKGVQSPDKSIAHADIIPNPSRDPQALCGKCHPDIVASFPNSLHFNQAGFWRALEKRSMPSTQDALQQALHANCSSCHVSCGECHVSQPNVTGGGFVNGHMFNRVPSMEHNCAVCHGSRVGNEYLGKNPGLPADVHYEKGKMGCADCHTGHDLHGQPAECSKCHQGPESAALQPADHRYGSVQAPSCESCHPNVTTGQDDILFHQMHGGNLSCQVCHSVAYNNCDGCHVAMDVKTNQATFDLQKSYYTFLIGRNPIQSYERPYGFVPVRHTPIMRDTFSFYGQDLLPLFDKVETWTYATPHNIQRKTPQTETCNACHGNPAFFLTADKVAPDELQANRNVIINAVPPVISSASQLP